MRRLVIVLAVLATLVVAPSVSAASWAKPYIREAVKSGLMGPSVPEFRPNDPLTRRDLGLIVVGITQRERTISKPDKHVTMTELNRALVNAVGLAPAASAFRTELGRAGLSPTDRAGWETVARLLSLRYNHPSNRDDLELRPKDVATRAEAAFSVWRLLNLTEWDLERVNELAGGFHLPDYSDWQKRVLDARRQVRRLPLRVGRHVREHPDALRRHLARRLRLLRPRLARLQARDLERRAVARHDHPRADDLPDGRRDEEEAPDPARQAPRRRT